MKLSLLPLAVSSLLLLGACGSVDASIEAPPPPPAGTEPEPAAKKPFDIQWASCNIPGGRQETIVAECATVDAPARRDGTLEGVTTPVAVYRLASKKQPATGQLWMLNGGPGGAGFSLAPYGQMVTTFAQGIDVYLVDHRGTGESENLECPRAARTSSTLTVYARECSKEIRSGYGDRVDGFSTTESAADVRDLIASTATPEQKIFLYGGSYGSYWAHRFLQLPETRIDAVVTDGNCISETCTFDVPQTFGMDEVMKFVTDVCKDQPSCSAKVGTDPWAFASQVAAKLKTGHCSAAKIAGYASANLIHALGVYLPGSILPVLYRLDRCSAADVTALDELAERLEQTFGGRIVTNIPDLGQTPDPTTAETHSRVLQFHVIASEMISKPAPTRESLVAKANTLVFAPDPMGLDLSYNDAWSGYPRDQYVGKWLERDVPWLMMQGTFDFQTVFSLSQRALEKVKDPALQFVRIDGGGHGVVFNSQCSLGMLEAFLANPRAKVDSSCVSQVTSTSLNMPPMFVQYFFGTTDVWD